MQQTVDSYTMPAQPLQIVIDTLVQSNVFSLVEGDDNRYLCICQSNIKRYSVRNHILTQKHKNALDAHMISAPVPDVPEPNIVVPIPVPEPNIVVPIPVPEPNIVSPISVPDVAIAAIECDICYEMKSTFRKCTTCRHEICTDCSSHVTRCPFCRQNYPVAPRPASRPASSRRRRIIDPSPPLPRRPRRRARRQQPTVAIEQPPPPYTNVVVQYPMSILFSRWLEEQVEQLFRR